MEIMEQAVKLAVQKQKYVGVSRAGYIHEFDEMPGEQLALAYAVRPNGQIKFFA